MQKTNFPYRLFFILLLISSIITFFAANTMSVTTYTNKSEMITPFPVALEFGENILQIVTSEQLSKIQLPDPVTKKRLVPNFLINEQQFTNMAMPSTSIIGESISNGENIVIPVNYSATISGKQLDNETQEITITYSNGAEEDQIITAIYVAQANNYTPKKQYVKNVLIWKTIFMNGMMASLILAFLICKKLSARKTKQAEPIS